MTTCYPSQEELAAQVEKRHGPAHKQGWSPRLKTLFGYFSPDVHYESLVAKLIGSDSVWLDLGCGAEIFPSNRKAAQELASRARLVIGVDPSENIFRNDLVEVKVHGMLSDYKGSDSVDVVTMRMVAEHVTEPEGLVKEIDRLTHPGSKVVIYTVSYWSIVTLISALVPFSLHHPIKKVLWRTREEDTFPVAYRMNTRRQLRSLFESRGFREETFAYLGDCRSFGRWRVTHFLELSLWKLLRFLRLPYVENCIVAVYAKQEGQEGSCAR